MALKHTFTRCTNIIPAHHGLGNRRIRLDPGEGAAKWDAVGDGLVGYRNLINHSNESSEAFNVEVLDQLVGSSGAWNGERLGLLHLDVEGSELDALMGSVDTLRRDLPLLTLELHVHQDADYSHRLLSATAALGYDAFVVEEMCGIRADCRNLICIPRARLAKFTRSPTLDLVTAARKLFYVDAASIAMHAYPCCKPGGACCRGKRNCCSKDSVASWLRHAQREYDNKGRAVGNRDPALYAPTLFLYQHKLRWPGPRPTDALYNVTA